MYFHFAAIIISAVALMANAFTHPSSIAKLSHDVELKQWSRSVIVRNANGTFIYQKLTACDNSIMVLKCRNGTAVKILSATYGRLDNKTCLKWHHQQQANVIKTTLPPIIARPPIPGESNVPKKDASNEYRPCYRNEIFQLRRQCSSDASSARDECVIFVDNRYQFSEPVCPVPPNYRDPFALNSRYAVVEFTCFICNNETNNETVYSEPDGYVMEKGNERLTQHLAMRVLSKAGITTFNQAVCSKQQKAEEQQMKDDKALKKRTGAKNQPCVSLDGVRLKNIRHLISLKRKSNCNDIYVIGGTEVKNSDHSIKVQPDDAINPGKKSRKRTHQNGYRLDIAASDPSARSFKAGNAGICVSSFIRKNFQRLSPTSDEVAMATMTQRQRHQVELWKKQQKQVFNDTTESGGVIYSFVAKPVPLWDILYP